MRPARTVRRWAALEEIGGVLSQERNSGLDQRRFDELPAPGPLPRHQRCEDAVARKDSSKMVGQRNSHRLGRRPFGQQAEQSTHPLADGVVARIVAVRTLPAEAADRAVDETLVERPQMLIAELHASEFAWPQILDQHIGAHGKAPKRFAPFLGFQVERDALLVAIERSEGRAVFALAPAAKGVALVRGLDLDDLRPQIRQQHSGERAADVACDLKDGYPGQSAIAHAITASSGWGRHPAAIRRLPNAASSSDWSLASKAPSSRSRR